MSNFSSVKKLIEATQQAFRERKIDSSSAVSNYVSGSVNLSHEEAIHAQTFVNEIEESVKHVIDNLSVEAYSETGVRQKFTQAQINAARMIAPYAMDPKGYAKRLAELQSPKTAGGQVVNVSLESMDVGDVVEVDNVVTEISNEAYDGQKLNNAVYFSIAYNLGAARQDEFGEAFFPTVAIDPVQSGVSIDVQFAVLYNEYNRSITGTVDKEKYKRTPIIKAIYDKSVFGTNRFKVVPVYRETSNKEFFVASEKYVDNTTGSSIETAPLVFGKEVELLGISQTDEMISKGVMDNTDSLDRTVGLEKVYYSLTDGTDTEIFSFDASIFSYRHFTYNPQQHHKDLTLNFNTKAIVVNISELKTAKGTTSALLTNLAQTYSNYKVVLECSINGSSNTMHANTIVYGNALGLLEVIDGAGNTVATTDQAYTEIATLFGKAKLEGYTIEAYRTNSNIRQRGLPVGVDVYSFIYTVPTRSGVTAFSPVQNIQGTDNDAGLLGSQIQFAGLFSSMYAVTTLVDFANGMHQASVNGLLGSYETTGIGQYLVNAWFRDSSFDLSHVVDSVQSHHRDDDIREALRLRIRQEVLDMYTHSNYGAAFDVLRGNLGTKIGVIIGTDPTIKTLLMKDGPIFDLGDNFEAHVVSTLNSLVAGKVFITFGVFGEDRNSVPNPLNFGNMFWSPTLSYEVTRAGAAINKELHNNPRFLHVINLPVLSVFNITDVRGVYDKIPVYSKTVTN